MLGDQRQPRRDGGDARDGGDLLRRRLGEGELRPRQEEVVDEVLAGLAELRQVGEHGAVGVDELPIAAESAGATTRVRLGRARDGEIGADARERVQRLGLRAVEAARERRDHDDERDAEREPEDGEDRPRPAAAELAPQVPDVEHDPEGTTHG